jgi:hypothetical protein
LTTTTRPALAERLVEGELLLTVEQPDGTRADLPHDDPRWARAWAKWQEWLAEYELGGGQ